MTNQPIPTIAASNVDANFRADDGCTNLVAGEITCAADEAVGIEPGIGQRLELVDEHGNSHTGVVVDRWKARDEQTGALSVEVVIERDAPAAAPASSRTIDEVIDEVVKTADIRARARLGKISAAFERRCDARIEHLRAEVKELVAAAEGVK